MPLPSVASLLGTDNSPIGQASRLSEIGFAEFTSKLINDTFDAIISANIRQTQSYLELVKVVSQSLGDFINSTFKGVSEEDAAGFLAPFTEVRHHRRGVEKADRGQPV